MLCVHFIDQTGEDRSELFDTMEEYNRETWNPDCEIMAIVPLVVRGKTYAERKESARDAAIELLDCLSARLTWGEYALICDWLKTQASRYGLTEEFLENGVI